MLAKCRTRTRTGQAERFFSDEGVIEGADEIRFERRAAAARIALGEAPMRIMEWAFLGV